MSAQRNPRAILSRLARALRGTDAAPVLVSAITRLDAVDSAIRALRDSRRAVLARTVAGQAFRALAIA